MAGVYQDPYSQRIASSFAGIKTSAVMCVSGAIVGEFVASKNGLGRLLRSAQANIDMATMFACLILLAVIGLLFFRMIHVAERLCMPWARRSGEGEKE